MPCERSSVEDDPIQEMLRGRSVDFLSLGLCPGYQEEVACYDPCLEENVFLKYFTSAQILDPLCRVHNPAELFHSREAVDPEDLITVKVPSIPSLK